VIQTLAISGYRSLRDLALPLATLNLVTGANGSGKSSLYRALRLLGDAALSLVVGSLAREGGLQSTLWAGPETIARSVRSGDHPVEKTASRKPVSLKLGLARSIVAASGQSQVIVVSHAEVLIEALEGTPVCQRPPALDSFCNVHDEHGGGNQKELREKSACKSRPN
jgi:predicted ATPase